MLKIFAILAALTGSVSCMVVTVPEKSVNTTVSGNITLLCTYRTEVAAPELFIQWFFYSAQERKRYPQALCDYYMDCQKMKYVVDARGRCSWRYKIYYSQRGQTYSYGEFKGRIQGVNSTGNASITIFNMQSSETGIYTCEVFNPADTNTQQERSVAVSVLVPPSQPLCSLRGTPEMGHLISLSCSSDSGMPLPTYQWQKVSEDTAMSVSESYNHKTGLLVIGNLSHFEEGYYRCTAANALGNSSCHINVTTSHSESGVIIGALIGAILVAALICGIVWFLTSREKRKKSKQKAAINEEQAAAPKEPLNAEYIAVPNQESAPMAPVPQSKESVETNEYVTPEEIEVTAEPGNEIQDAEHEPAA